MLAFARKSVIPAKSVASSTVSRTNIRKRIRATNNLFIVYPPVSLYIIATHTGMLACIDFGRDRLCRGKEKKFRGEVFILIYEYLKGR
jgi:hypothetical protein